MEKVTEGSFVKVDYIAKKAEDNTVFDTTIKEIAEKHGIFSPSKFYEPILLVIGREWLPKIVEDSLLGKTVGESVEVDVPFADAFGPHDPSKIKLVPRREFQKLQINPQKGEYVNISGQEGLILSVSPGRVRIDFNHKLAGKDLHYTVTIRKVINDELEKIQALINRRLPGADISDSIIEINGEALDVILPDRVRFYEYIQFAKKNIAKDIGAILGKYTEVHFHETYPTKE
ncbi:MAG: peptidylprolyl isomerase [Methanobacteriota archaeon]|nr:MAG: peptidylprolyl isomerase [Euryarchaeota archaeon]